MQGLSVRTVRLDSGERTALLTHGPLGLPVLRAVEFVVMTMRPKSHKLSTTRHSLRGLALGLSFFSELGIDLVKRAAQRRFLSRAELVALSERCRVSEDESRAVDPHYAATRFRVCTDYVKWIAEPVIARITDESKQVAALKALESFEKRAKSAAPRADAVDGHVPGERLGLTPEQRELFLRAILPGDEANPYSEELQVRNYAMLLLAYELGPRAGEIRGLKVQDFDFSTVPASVTIHRRPNDPDDTRPTPAAAKTLARILHMDDKLRDAIDIWLTHHRSNRELFPAARKTPYAFVNYRGEAISDRGLRMIVSKLITRHPSLAPLFLHLFRHDWNDRFNEVNGGNGDNFAELDADQKYAMGWSPNSKMPLLYGKRSIRESANRRIVRMQQSGKEK